MPRASHRSGPAFASPTDGGQFPAARGGWTLAELIAAMVVFSGLLLAVVPLLLRLQRALPGLGHRQQALLTASSLLDHCVRQGEEGLPVGDWPSSKLPEFARAEHLRTQIPEASARVWVEVQGEPAARRVWVEIIWPQPPGQPEARVRLSAWVPVSVPAAGERAERRGPGPGPVPTVQPAAPLTAGEGTP